MAKAPKITAKKPAGARHRVLTMEGGQQDLYRREPCATCPWRVDAVGEFPPEAFRHSANTAYDRSMARFACHSSGLKRPATCAGFLLRGAFHNISVRLAIRMGSIKDDVADGGHELHESYRAMAIANGVDPNDPILTPCRANGYDD